MIKKLLLGLVAVSMMTACQHSSNSTSTGSDTTAAASTATAPAAVANPDAPIMKFDKPLHDFGKIKAGEKVTYEFAFTNSGKSPLIISDAVATCGCTKPEWPKTPIKPGEAASIKVTFDSKGKMGLQDKMITITANTQPAQNMVHLVGEVLLK